MNDLQASFSKEPRSKKIVLGAAAVGLISTFLPWFSVSFGGFGTVSTNGWHRFGLLTAIGSALMVLNWALPKVGVKFSLPLKADVLEKVLSGAILAGPALWLLDTSFEFELVGMGLYVALAAGATACYFVFAKGRKGEPSKTEGPKK